MFTKNRVLVIHDEDLIIVHLNGLEIATIYESWDSIDAIEEIIKAIDKLSDKQRQRRFSFTVVDAYGIEIDEIAEELLYEVKQFTQEEFQWEGTKYGVVSLNDEIPAIKTVLSVVHTVTTTILIVILLIVV